MARTRKTTDSVEQPENVVELQPGIQEQEPVEQLDETAQVSEPVDEAEGERIDESESEAAPAAIE